MNKSTLTHDLLSEIVKIEKKSGPRLKRQLEAEYRKMPKEMREQFDKTFAELAKTYPNAWVSKFNHATALSGPH
jgi:hypothetical protein